jgi:arsenate reductase (thioredoxin)
MDGPKVLFVCVHNAGRSHITAALSTITPRVGSRSGPREAHRPTRSTPAVIAVMDEIGIDLSKEFPKLLSDEAVEAADVVVSMGCGDACPVFPGKRYLDWELPDPAGKGVEEVRAIRDEIDQRVKSLLAELVPALA